jgi:uncharacterized protein YndB with AHSA1/START domain
MPDLITLLDLTKPAELWSAWTEPERAARWLGVIDGDFLGWLSIWDPVGRRVGEGNHRHR